MPKSRQVVDNKKTEKMEKTKKSVENERRELTSFVNREMYY